MASLRERIEDQKHDVWYWRRKEDEAVDATQKARRIAEREPTDNHKRDVRRELDALKHTRKMLDAAENKYERLQSEWSHLEPLDKQEDYWRDRVQDLHREVIRCQKIVQRMRREEQADKLAAKGEIELAAEFDQTPRADVSDAVLPDDTDFRETDKETGTVLGDTLVFTAGERKKLTEAELRLVYVKGLWHHAQSILKRVRKEQEEKGDGEGTRTAVVKAAIQCMNHSGSYHYSQSGSWRMGYFPGGEPWGVRSDCSQWFTKCYNHAGANDPNGQRYTGGYTGTLGQHGSRVGSPRPGDAVLVGTYPYHHVEMYVGTGEGCSQEVRDSLRSKGANGQTTIGHGDRYVNFGSLPWYSPRTYRSYF